MAARITSQGFVLRLQRQQIRNFLSRVRYLSTETEITEDTLKNTTTSIDGEQPQPTETRDPSFFITSEQDPAKHSTTDLGKFYTVPPEDAKKAFTHGLTRRFAKQSKTIGDVCLMVRQPALDIIKELKEVKENQAPQKFVIYGPDSCGKSLTLFHVLHLCSTQGWLIVHIPDVFDWLHCAKNISNSTTQPGLFDLPDEATVWLQNFRNINKSFLTQMVTTKDYKFGRRQELIEKGVHLLKVVEMGLSRPNYATTAIEAIVHELGQETATKILFAVDNFNGFFYRTTLRDSAGKFFVQEPEHNQSLPHELTRPPYLLAKDLSLVQLFRKLLDPTDGLKYGAMVLALSRIRMYKMPRLHWSVEELLGYKGLKVLGDHTKIQVTDYNNEEMISALDFYHHKKFFSKVVSPQVEAEVNFLTQRKPLLITKLCAPF